MNFAQLICADTKKAVQSALKKADLGKKHHIAATKRSEQFWFLLPKYKIKTSKSLVDTSSCLIKVIPSQNSSKPVDPQKDIGVTALVAIVEQATENSSLKGTQIPLRSCPSNKKQMLLSTGSNPWKRKTQPFSYLTRQGAKSWHTSNEMELREVINLKKVLSII